MSNSIILRRAAKRSMPAACLIAVLAFASASAGEAAKKKPARANDAQANFDKYTALIERERAAAAGDVERRPVAEMNLSQLRQFQAFHYVRGGRDPLRYRTSPRRVDVEETIEASGPKRPSEIEQEAALTQAVQEAESLILARNYAGARARLDAMLDVVETAWKGITPGSKRLEELMRHIRERRSIADDLDRQQKTDMAFGRIGLVVDGVQWTPRGAVAVVNGQPYEAGMALGQEKPLSEVRIDAIDERRVTFHFQGFRFQREPLARPGAKKAPPPGSAGKGAPPPLDGAAIDDLRTLPDAPLPER